MRIDSLDILKGIGIILVVVGHMIGNQLYIRPWIYAFHMPLFFMLGKNICHIAMRGLSCLLSFLGIPFNI